MVSFDPQSLIEVHLMMDAVNVIIFLAPLSGFDQVLEEDDTVNRLVRDFVIVTWVVPSSEFDSFWYIFAFIGRFPETMGNDLLQPRPPVGRADLVPQ